MDVVVVLVSWSEDVVVLVIVSVVVFLGGTMSSSELNWEDDDDEWGEVWVVSPSLVVSDHRLLLSSCLRLSAASALDNK